MTLIHVQYITTDDYMKNNRCIYELCKCNILFWLREPKETTL